jgi:hypothetical protein
MRVRGCLGWSGKSRSIFSDGRGSAVERVLIRDSEFLIRFRRLLKEKEIQPYSGITI